MGTELLVRLQTLRTPWGNTIFELLTILGEESVLIPVVLFVYWILNKEKGEFLGYSLIASLGLNEALKTTIQRPRPFEVDSRVIPLRPSTATGYSFPSGHTQGAASAGTALAILFKRRKIWFIVLTLSLLVALSRLYLGVHFLSDVIVSLALGGAVVFFAHYLFHTIKRRYILYLGTLLLYLPFLLLWGGKDFYTVYGFLCGFTLGVEMERRYINFTLDLSRQKKILRLLLGLILVFGVQFGVKEILPEGYFFRLFRYIFVSWTASFLYPLFFHRFRF